MDTRLKDIKFSNWFKLAAVSIGIIGVILSFYGMIRYQDFPYGVEGCYKESKILTEEIGDIHTNILLLIQLKSEENIKSGTVITEEALKRKIDDLRDEKNHEIRRMTREYESLTSYHKENNFNEFQRLIAERDEKTSDVKLSYDKKIAGAKEVLIVEKIVEYNKAKRFIENYEGLYYTVVPKGAVSGKEIEFYNTLPYYTKSSDTNDGIIYIGFLEDTFAKQAAEYEVRHNYGLTGIYMLLSGLGLMMLTIGWLIFSAGRTVSSRELQFGFFDKVYLDVGLFITGVSVMPCCILAAIMIIEKQKVEIYNYFSLVLLVIAYLIMAAYAVMFAKRVKSSEVLQHTLLYKFITVIKKTVNTTMESPIDSRHYAKRAIWFLLLYAIAIGVVGLVFVMLAIAVPVAISMLVALGLFILLLFGIMNLFLKRVTGFITLAEGIKKIKNGDFTHTIPACGIPGIDSIAEDINNITEGVKVAVDREMKAEHMKVELITNVSHDLKTPLTSIVTYSDLLSREDVTAEQVKQYVEILKRKSVCLKQMVDDLFEVSKAQSGNISIEMETLCLNDLITQSFAEYEDDFRTASLDVILDVPQDKVMVLADGGKMWRVLSNIFNNAIKYSMSGTRVYVELEVVEDKANITVKNIANYIMDFKSAEICERFKRGNESRSGEGSGLGLAIVKSFMELQDGSCDVLFDGDLFKVILTLPQIG